MHTLEAPVGRTVLVRLDPGEDILEALTAAASQAGIGTGLILSGVGSVTKYRVHVVETTNLPPGDVFFGEDGAYDVLAMQGVVIDGRVHAHIVFSDTKKAFGGHLEKGCEVLTFCMVVLAETPGVSLDGWDSIGDLATIQGGAG